jgi:hypothetical protein
MVTALKNSALAGVILCLGLLSATVPVSAKEFTFDEKVNQRVAKKLGIPVYFAVPASARAPIPGNINTNDQLIDFKHPDGIGKGGDVGLRVILAKRAGMGKRLAKSGLVQNGDLLLTVRPEWGGAGAYPNIQMGVSHTGIAYIKDGEVRNLDNPMNDEYLGPGLKGQLNSVHYKTLNMIHIVRPRGLTEEQRARVYEWTTRLASGAKKIYPTQISFNQDYNAPKYSSRKPYTYVKHLGQAALGQNPGGTVDMFCSEFLWSILALRDCDPNTHAADFEKSDVPSCVSPAMRPMRAAGNYVDGTGRDSSYVGLADGPLLVINALGLPQEEEDKLLKAVFVADPKGLAKMSSGHRKLAQDMEPKFGPLEKYYLGVSGRGWARTKARVARTLFNRQVPDNYSPTSYLINTLLPENHPARTMDYVATIVIE